MPKIATLGPANTFSELAAKLYKKQTGKSDRICLYSTFSKAFEAMKDDCETGIFPIENMIEGHVSNVLDLLVDSEFSIASEMLLPIQFSLAANCQRLEDIKKVYVQFVSQRQCEKILGKVSQAAVFTTESNGASLEQVKKGITGEAAIVPSFCVKEGDFGLVVHSAADYSNNQTRFVVVKKAPSVYDASKSYKTSLLVYEGTDKAGVLSSILTAFSSRQINLVSIMSRPTKEMLGRYHFFIDIEGYFLDTNVQEALAEIEKENVINFLGSYPKAPSGGRSPATGEVKPFTGLGDSPFACNRYRPSVFWSAGSGPYENTIKALSGIDLSPAKGKTVLLKPNVGRNVGAALGINTHPEVVAAAIDAFRQVGADVAVGESPITGVKTLEAFESCGIAAVARARDCPLIDMNARKFVAADVPEGIAINSLKICREVTEFDIVVSIAVMKTHMHTGVTIAVKNMKGCLWRRSKVELHMLDRIDGYDDKPLDIAITDMSGILRPHLSIIDGTVGLEGLGPGAGKAKPLGVVLAGVDALASDAVACEIMGINPVDIAHLRMGADRGFGVIDLKSINVQPGGLEKIRSPFQRPPEKLSIEFKGFNILDEQSCSACQSTLLLFLKKHGNELLESSKGGKDINIAIGKGHADLPEGTICIGNCTVKHRNKGVFVPGCPPVASAILNEYFENLDSESG